MGVAHGLGLGQHAQQIEWASRIGAPAERARYEAYLSEARSALSADAFATAWAAGEAMTADDAVTYALFEGD